MKTLFAALCGVVTLAPLAHATGTCDQWLRMTVRATGNYLPADEAYSRPFVFALSLDCNGTRQRVTVERATGGLPVCKPNQPVEVLGKLTWNGRYGGGHYEINDPISVTCR
jgi:hypothetical protein